VITIGCHSQEARVLHRRILIIPHDVDGGVDCEKNKHVTSSMCRVSDNVLHVFGLCIVLYCHVVVDGADVITDQLELFCPAQRNRNRFNSFHRFQISRLNSNPARRITKTLLAKASTKVIVFCQDKYPSTQPFVRHHGWVS
jgi:hypothetical protein